MKNFPPKEFRIVFLWFKIMGCFDSPVQRTIYTITLSIFAFVVLLGEFIGFLNRYSVQERGEMFFYVAVLFYFGRSYLAIRCNYGELLEFLTSISRPTGVNYELQSIVLQQALQKVSAIFPRVFVIFASLIIIGIFQWCFSPLLEDFDYHNKNFHIAPYLYQCADDGGNGFPLKSICIRMNSLAPYILVNFLLTMVTLWGCVLHAGTFTFSVCMCIFVKTNLEVLVERLLKLHKKVECFLDKVSTVQDNRLISRQQYEAALRNEFIKIIQYHQYLHR